MTNTTTSITVTDYQTGAHVRVATAGDIAAAAECDSDTGAFACPVTGRSVFLEGVAFDGIAYTLDASDEQVERFEREAGEAGDLEAVAICRRALAGDDLARAEVAGWIAEGEAMLDVDDLVDADGDCRECGHPADGSSGWGTCDSPAHR